MADELKTEHKAQAVSLLCKGNSIHSVEGITGILRDTVMRLGVSVGEGRQQIMDAQNARPEFPYYNFVKTHGALRMTPAQAAGVESSA